MTTSAILGMNTIASFFQGIATYSKDHCSTQKNETCLNSPFAIMHASSQLVQISRIVPRPVSYILYTVIAANVARFALYNLFYRETSVTDFIGTYGGSSTITDRIRESCGRIRSIVYTGIEKPVYKTLDTKDPSKPIFWLAERTGLVIQIGNIFKALIDLKENKPRALAYLTTTTFLLLSNLFPKDETEDEINTFQRTNKWAIETLAKGAFLYNFFDKYQGKVSCLDFGSLKSVQAITSHCFNVLKQGCHKESLISSLRVLKDRVSLENVASAYALDEIFGFNLINQIEKNVSGFLYKYATKSKEPKEA